MIDRRCDQCDRPYRAQRSTSKYCSEKCRNDAKTKPPAVLKLAAATGAGPRPGGVTAAVEKTLDAAHRKDTVPGQLALVLALRLDNAASETGAGLASLSKHLELMMATALEGAPREPDFIDELEERRQAKFGA